MILITSYAIPPTGSRRMVSFLTCHVVPQITPSQTPLLVVDHADGSEKEEWPLSQNANFEAPPDANQPFDYNAVPSTFYFDVEASGSVQVKEVITQGLDILATNLARVIEGVEIETGGREEDAEEDVGGMGLVEPGMGGGGGGYYGEHGGGGEWQGNGMSPLRR
jgi:DNA-directed RNA polymerase II subunit RPB3